MSKRWLLVDYGGVLARDHLQPPTAEMARLFGCSIDQVRNALTERSLAGRGVRLDQLSEHEFWGEISQNLTGLSTPPASPSDLTALWAATYELDAEVAEILDEVSAGGVSVGIATNVDRYREPYLRQAVRHLQSNPQIFSSYEAGFLKPEAKYFKSITVKLGLSGQENAILFFDDRSEHVGAARSCGWLAERFENAASFRRVLRDKLNGNGDT